MKIENSYIILNNLVIHAFHGVASQENLVGNDFIINAKIKLDLTGACISDSVKDTVSYADIYQSILSEMKQTSKLLEHVAYRIVNRLFEEYKEIDQIELELNKNMPPMGADIKSAGVLLKCSR